MRPDFLTTKETMKVLHMGYNRLLDTIHTDPTFPAVRLGERKWIILGNRLEEWLMQQKKGE